tara:strand:- start:812 stop:985 length:174 start_codon:yes stop_codon:yes gene_type:complete
MEKPTKETLKEAIDKYISTLSRRNLERHLRSELFHGLWWGGTTEDQWEFIKKMEQVK